MKDCIFCKIQKNKQDPTRIVELNYSVALVNFDQTYPGRSILMLKEHYEDMVDMPENVFNRLNDDMRKVAAAIKKEFRPDHMNYCIIGNEVPHIHWHIIPRYSSDVNWGRPPWPIKRRRILTENEYRIIAKRIQKRITEKTESVR